ncbi:MAG: hypothetical protein ABI852_17270 [Gemmatimonadaceae bacterium]
MLNQIAAATLLPDPLHPAIVHMPIALMVLVPAFAAGALWAIKRGAAPLRAWGITTALLAALALSAWASLETGDSQGERVEKIVAEAPLETHEEAAETFLTLSVIVLGIAVLGLRNGKLGSGARLVASAGTLGLLIAGYNVGHSGGALVYTHGAATAYTSGASARAVAGADGDGEDRR